MTDAQTTGDFVYVSRMVEDRADRKTSLVSLTIYALYVIQTILMFQFSHRCISWSVSSQGRILVRTMSRKRKVSNLWPPYSEQTLLSNWIILVHFILLNKNEHNYMNAINAMKNEEKERVRENNENSGTIYLFLWVLNNSTYNNTQ